MPFDEETKDVEAPRNTGLKNVSSKKSIFDGKPKKTSPEEFRKQVQAAEDQKSETQLEGKELSQSFLKILSDKTLKENKNPFVKSHEKEVIAKMVEFGVKVNNDEQEQEGMGSMSWIALLLNLCVWQRDRMNQLEYEVWKLRGSDLDKNENKG